MTNFYFRTTMITDDEPEGEIISRKYTPTSKIHDKGTFELLVKTYYKNTNPDFPKGGVISQYLDTINVGDNIQIRGPMGKLSYFGDGDFEILKSFKPLTFLKPNFKKIGMLAMGTGIAPMFQILQSAHFNLDTIEVGLVFSNRTEEDILLRKELEEFENAKNFKFKLTLTLTKV